MLEEICAGIIVNDEAEPRAGREALKKWGVTMRALECGAPVWAGPGEAQLQSAQDALRIARVQYPAQLQSAEAQQRAASAALAQADASYLRRHEVDRRATTQEIIDQATSERQNARASLSS